MYICSSVRQANFCGKAIGVLSVIQQESLALASMARDESPASSTAAAAARRPMLGKVGSEFEI